MNVRYGLQKMALINSANYDYATLPLDAAMGLLADNNMGKTSLVNALQFPLVPDRRRLSFGGHTPEESRRFYFPDDSSYVLVELLTAGGTVVVGCVGMGIDHDYGHFAYAGELNLQDYRTDAGKIVRSGALQEHMAGRDIAVYRYRSDEYRDRLFCVARNLQAGEPNFGLFRVRPDQDNETFQTIFTRVLRLDDLSAESIKRDMLEIYRSDVRERNVNFRKEWELAFVEVNKAKGFFEAAGRSADDIERLARLREVRVELRSQVIHQMSKIDGALKGWEEHHFEESQLLKGKAATLRQSLADIDQRFGADHAEQADCRSSLRALEALQEELAGLRAQFDTGMTLSRPALLEEVDRIARQRLLLMDDLKSAEDVSASALERSLRHEKERLAEYEAELASTGANLHGALQRALEPGAVEGLSRALAKQVLTLPADRFELEAGPLASAIDGTDTTRLCLPGMTLDLHDRTIQYLQRPNAEIQEDIRRQTSRVAESQRKLDATANTMKKRAELEGLGQEEQGARRRVERFDRFKDLADGEAARLQQLTTVAAQLKTVSARIASIEKDRRELLQAVHDAETAVGKLEEDHAVIQKLQANRRERTSRWLAGMEHKQQQVGHTLGLPASIPITQLRSAMDRQDVRCLELERAERESHDLLESVRRDGLNKFAGDGGSEEELRQILDYHANRDRERQWIEKATRAALNGVGAALGNLRDGLKDFDARVARFNRLITRRRISDLSVFRINVVSDQVLVSDIELLIDNLEEQATQQMALLDGATRTSSSKIDRAFKRLTEQHELKLESLFALEFEIGKSGHSPTRHRQLRGAASDGTTAMAKLVIGLALLSELRDPHHEVHATCYMDEAAKPDERNQRSLIECADAFGFSLVMAAPSQLMTPTYCIPIDVRGGRNRVDQTRWVVIHQREQEAEAQSTSGEEVAAT